MDDTVPAKGWWSVDDYRAIVIGVAFLTFGILAHLTFSPYLLNELDILTSGKLNPWFYPLDAFKLQEGSKIPYLFLFFGVTGTLTGLGAAQFSSGWMSYLKGYLFVFLVGVLAFVLASNETMMDFGFGYAAWAIILGLIISNTLGTPTWAKEGLKTGFFIKTGLVLLGAEVLFSKIAAIGIPGLAVAWVVTPVVLVSTYWFGQKVLKIPSRTLNITISADMSVCGVSAAVATASACNAKKEELTLAVGLSMLFTSFMMIVMPLVISFLGLPEVLGGAWIGGTIDSTGAVAVAGEFLGEQALYVAATIKMIQNILIGIVAFFVAVYFARTATDQSPIQEPGFNMIWQRFPKFILGFIGTSLVFSLIHGLLEPGLAQTFIEDGVIKNYSKNLRGWFFCLAFVSIGLSTNFKELKTHFKSGKPLILYICGQSLNIMLTLLIAYLMFYVLFPEITASFLQ